MREEKGRWEKRKEDERRERKMREEAKRKVFFQSNVPFNLTHIHIHQLRRYKLLPFSKLVFLFFRLLSIHSHSLFYSLPLLRASTRTSAKCTESQWMNGEKSEWNEWEKRKGPLLSSFSFHSFIPPLLSSILSLSLSCEPSPVLSFSFSLISVLSFPSSFWFYPG